MIKLLTLSRGRFAIVDDEDFLALSLLSWCCHKRYAGTTLLGERVLMHRLLLDCPDSLEVDHVNGDPLDNRKSNLRICTREQNSRNKRKSYKNTSGYKGVSWHKRDRRWYSQIEHKSKSMHLGCFKNREAAARAYDEAAVKYFGEFARTNF